jgi:lipoprotein-anchoring transpeptidase ErfK/SrfK
MHTSSAPRRRSPWLAVSALTAAIATGSVLAASTGLTAALGEQPPVVTRPPAGPPPPAHPCQVTGPAQRAAEAYLAAHPESGPVTADGAQSAADCAAIRRIQERFAVASPSGYADALTGRILAQVQSARTARCGTGPSESGTVVCVDLTTQTMWVTRDGRIVLGPTVVRTGGPGERTPAGRFVITAKKRHTVSSITGTPMEYWQHLRGGYGFHQAWKYLYDPSVNGSLGCVNMTPRDSRDLFTLTEPGTPVRIIGRRPGT